MENFPPAEIYLDGERPHTLRTGLSYEKEKIYVIQYCWDLLVEAQRQST